MNDKGPQLIVARHEQNAAFMAQGIWTYYRYTWRCELQQVDLEFQSLATGLVTATDEGDPVLAISGQVKRADLLKRSHQSMKNVAMMEPVTKYAVEVHEPDTLSETIANAYRVDKVR